MATQNVWHTVRNLHFLSKNSTLISRENCRILGVKNSWKCFGFGLFSCWQLSFHEKNCQKKFWVKNSWKCWGFVKIEFLDKKFTFRIVWAEGMKCYWCTDAISGNYNTFDPNALLDQKTTTYLNAMTSRLQYLHTVAKFNIRWKMYRCSKFNGDAELTL